MRLPDELREALDVELDVRGFGRLLGVEPVGGGCITETGRLRTSDDRDFFLKWTTSERHPVGLFTAEAASLGALAATGAVRIPDVVHVRDGQPGDHTEDGLGRWLLLEWLEAGAAVEHTWSSLGRSLAAVHRQRAAKPGWASANFIGTLPQANSPLPGWPDFWRERRLVPQIQRAVEGGFLHASDIARFDRLLVALDDVLAPAESEGASLLHGDLWSGNLHVLRSGDPALVDPACYHGHREVDLAMSELFGGFDRVFYAAYDEAWPLEPGYAETRRAVYQLYYLLVHVNLFGEAYRVRTLSALESTGF